MKVINSLIDDIIKIKTWKKGDQDKEQVIKKLKYEEIIIIFIKKNMT